MNETKADWPRFTGILLATGCLVFIAGIVLYVLVGPELSTPSFEPSYPEALKRAAQLGAATRRAGQVTFIGDMLVASAALALIARRRSVVYDLERVGWSLVFVSFVPAFVFDSLMGTAIPRLAIDLPAAFPAFKYWYDIQFAAGNLPFGIGGAAVFYADSRSAKPLLAKPLAYFGIAVSAALVVGGLGYCLEIFASPTVNGGFLLLAALVLGALGIQMARKEP